MPGLKSLVVSLAWKLRKRKHVQESAGEGSRKVEIFGKYATKSRQSTLFRRDSTRAVISASEAGSTGKGLC